MNYMNLQTAQIFIIPQTQKSILFMEFKSEDQMNEAHWDLLSLGIDVERGSTNYTNLGMYSHFKVNVEEVNLVKVSGVFEKYSMTEFSHDQ